MRTERPMSMNKCANTGDVTRACYANEHFERSLLLLFLW